MPAPVFLARLDPRLRARIVSERALTYDGAKPIRAGSAIAKTTTDRLVVLQDDADQVAVVDGPGGAITAYDLRTPGANLGKLREGGHLQLKGVVVAKDWRGEYLLAFGSGATPGRRWLVRARFGGGDTELSVFETRRLFSMLDELDEFATSALNIEGVALLPKGLDGRDGIRLFQRANGAPKGHARALSATCDLRLDSLSAYLDRCKRDPGASLGFDLLNVRRYDLEERDEIPYSFTDAGTMPSGRIAYIAAAERARADGTLENLGTTLGVIDPDGSARYTILVERDGTPTRRKAEGIAPTSDKTACIVVDPEEQGGASVICNVDLTGF